MKQYEKPLPFVTEDGEPFWAGCKRRELLIQRCKECGHRQFPPRVICASCSSMELEWVKTSGRGTVYSYTIVYRPPTKAFSADAPYVVALIDLDEGVRIMSNVVGCKVEEIRVGLPVEVKYTDVTEETTLPLFTPRLEKP